MGVARLDSVAGASAVAEQVLTDQSRRTSASRRAVQRDCGPQLPRRRERRARSRLSAAAKCAGLLPGARECCGVCAEKMSPPNRWRSSARCRIIKRWLLTSASNERLRSCHAAGRCSRTRRCARRACHAAWARGERLDVREGGVPPGSRRAATSARIALERVQAATSRRQAARRGPATRHRVARPPRLPLAACLERSLRPR